MSKFGKFGNDFKDLDGYNDRDFLAIVEVYGCLYDNDDDDDDDDYDPFDKNKRRL